MPYREYHCEACGDLEYHHKSIADDSLTVCPWCKASEGFQQTFRTAPPFSVSHERRMYEDWDPNRREEYDAVEASFEKTRQALGEKKDW